MSIGDWGKAGDQLYKFDRVVVADFSEIEHLKAKLRLSNDCVLELEGIDALHAAYMMHPSVVEGKRMRFARHAWAVHNLIGHPLMQLLAFFKLYKQAMWIHEVTVPKCKVPRDA